MKKYLITSREYYTDTPAIFRNILHQQFSEFMPDFALYRDKSNPNYTIQAAHFVEVCNQFENIKGFIHRDVELAKELNAYGVHLTSTQFEKIIKAKELGLNVIISTHTHEEVLEAQRLGADFVTYSPIFTSPNKGVPKGIDDLQNLMKTTDIKIFALGGIINSTQVKLLEKIKPYGFASIRYFY
jgi:thiamine-phosphate pyrophosphorylase